MSMPLISSGENIKSEIQVSTFTKKWNQLIRIPVITRQCLRLIQLRHQLYDPNDLKNSYNPPPIHKFEDLLTLTGFLNFEKLSLFLDQLWVDIAKGRTYSSAPCSFVYEGSKKFLNFELEFDDDELTSKTELSQCMILIVQWQYSLCQWNIEKERQKSFQKSTGILNSLFSSFFTTSSSSSMTSQNTPNEVPVHSLAPSGHPNA